MANTIDGMKIGGAPIGPGSVVRPTADGSNTPSQTPQQGGDVQITGSAATLAQLEQTVRSLPAIDASRVETISRAIASGQYSIDSSRIAAGLIGSERTLNALPTEEL
jgi:negative regulator of flagellin synthesis FlgM